MFGKLRRPYSGIMIRNIEKIFKKKLTRSEEVRYFSWPVSDILFYAMNKVKGKNHEKYSEETVEEFIIRSTYKMRSK